MVATAEAQRVEPTSNWQTAEYALSLERLGMVGQIALTQTVESPEIVGPRAQLRAEFDTSLSEMIKTDPEFGKQLEITRFETYEVRDGRVLCHDGQTAVVDMLENGAKLSARMAVGDNRMATQARRDGHDLTNALEVEAMARGERPYNTRIVASLLPEEAVARDGEAYWRGMGYFPEAKTAFLQLYHVTEDGRLMTGTLSVDATDKASMRALWADLGVQVPETEITDNWLQYPLNSTMTAAEAELFVKSVRAKHYAKMFHQARRPTSIEDVLAANAHIVDQSFDQLYISLAEALARRRKTDTIRDLIAGFMQKSQQLGPDMRTSLITAHNKEYFSDDHARLVYKLIMYATVEEIRKSLPLVKHTTIRPTQVTSASTYLPNNVPPPYAMPTQNFVNQLVQSAMLGVQQQRSYGSCGAEIKIQSNIHDDSPAAVMARMFHPQDIFGGMVDQDHNETNDDDDGLGPLEFKCTEGHDNKREKGQLITKCKEDDCKGSVGCG